MHTWETLTDTSTLLTRNRETEESYQDHCKKVLCTFPSLSQYIREKVIANTSGMYLTLNRFPYHLEQGVHHFILWNPHEESLDDCTHFVHTHLNPFFFDTLLRQNLPHHRSVPDIPHYHVFVRRKYALENGLRCSE